jgi:PAS domain-containing protein
LRPRHIAPIALILGLTAVGFVIARASAEQGARRDAERRADVATAQLGGRVAQAVSLTESLRRFMEEAGGTGVTNAQFSRNAFGWLSPAGLPAAAWVERVPASQRAGYERRNGQPIVSPDAPYRVLPAGSRSSYLPATLVSGFPPLAEAGVDLGREPGVAEAVRRATRVNGVAAAAPGAVVSGMRGLLLVAPAPNLIDSVLRPGYVVLFVPDATLRAAVDAPGLQLAVGRAAPRGGDAVRRTFEQAGQRFSVAVPQSSLTETAGAAPWIILGAGLVLAGFAGALALNAARRAHAQAELDRIFTLSSDLIAVADLSGRYTRVNPAFEHVLDPARGGGAGAGTRPGRVREPLSPQGRFRALAAMERALGAGRGRDLRRCPGRDRAQAAAGPAGGAAAVGHRRRSWWVTGRRVRRDRRRVARGRRRRRDQSHAL